MANHVWGWTLRAALFGAGLAAMAGTASQAGTLSIGHTTWVGYGPLYLARDLGYFKDGGLTVELPTNEEASDSMAAEASGRMSGTANTVDEILQYRSKDFCFKAVLALDESHGGDGVLTPADMTSLEQVKGNKVALNEGSVSQFWFYYLLKKHGMSPSDVTIANMSADDAAAAFIAKRVPVAVSWEPNLTFARTHNIGKVLIDSSSTPGVIIDVVQLRCDVIQNQPEDVRTLVKGYYKALDYIAKDPQKSYEIMAKGIGGYLSKPADFADAMKSVRFYTPAMNADYFGTAQKPGQIGDTIQLGVEIWGGLGKVKMKSDYADVVDPQFVRQ